MDKVTVPFTRAELWMLHGFVRHEMFGQDQWRNPPIDRDLNELIALSIAKLENPHAGSVMIGLELNEHQLLVIDYWIRSEYKTVEGARGKDILLKTFDARYQLQATESEAITPEIASDLITGVESFLSSRWPDGKKG